jgi:hypothetical protein
MACGHWKDRNSVRSYLLTRRPSRERRADRLLLRSDGITGHRGPIERTLLRSDGITGHRGPIERTLLRSDGITGRCGAIERTLLTE